MSVILASGSPRRRELMSRLDVPFEVIAGALAERQPDPGEPPETYVQALATEKAQAIARDHPGRIVVGGDTVVVADDVILGKPSDSDHAVRMLQLLRAKPHRVVSGVALVCPTAEYAGVVSTDVFMRDYSFWEVKQYVDSGEPLDKAGAYAVQGLGGDLVDRVSGCFESVVGFPLCLVRDLLMLVGVSDVDPARALCTHL